MIATIFIGTNQTKDKQCDCNGQIELESHGGTDDVNQSLAK